MEIFTAVPPPPPHPLHPLHPPPLGEARGEGVGATEGGGKGGGQATNVSFNTKALRQQILAFVTGADCIPPLGFDINRAVLFSTDRSRLLPVAFTCALTHENVSH